MESAFQRPGPLRLESTNLEAEWTSFLQKFEIFLLASGSEGKSSETRLAMLLNFAGDEALKLYNTFTYDSPSDNKKIEIVLNKFNSYCLPRKNTVFERFKFWLLTQQPGESVDAFATTLRSKASSCDFGDQTVSMIRDRIVLGHPNRHIQERLLRESDLTLQRALEICRASESTLEKMQSISGNSAAVSAVRGREQKSGKTTTQHGRTQPSSHCRATNGDGSSCGNCGASHLAKSCPAFGKQCHACLKFNHFSAQCRSSRSTGRGRSTDRQHTSTKSRPHPSSSVHEISNAERQLVISSCASSETNSTLLAESDDVFHGPGCFPGQYHIATDPSVSSVIHPPCRVPLSRQPKSKQQAEVLVKRDEPTDCPGILVKRDEPTDWVNSLLLVEKKDGTLRSCLDPCDLNRAYAIPTSDDVAARIHGKEREHDDTLRHVLERARKHNTIFKEQATTTREAPPEQPPPSDTPLPSLPRTGDALHKERKPPDPPPSDTPLPSLPRTGNALHKERKPPDPPPSDTPLPSLPRTGDALHKERKTAICEPDQY